MSTATGIGIITILSFFIVWIGFPANNPQDSFKDALGFAGGLFGGLATFGAAIIAAYLFNHWKDIERFNRERFFHDEIMSTIHLAKNNLFQLVFLHESLINIDKQINSNKNYNKIVKSLIPENSIFDINEDLINQKKIIENKILELVNSTIKKTYMLSMNLSWDYVEIHKANNSQIIKAKKMLHSLDIFWHKLKIARDLTPELLEELKEVALNADLELYRKLCEDNPVYKSLRPELSKLL